jgi:hypothetical protein
MASTSEKVAIAPNFEAVVSNYQGKMYIHLNTTPSGIDWKSVSLHPDQLSQLFKKMSKIMKIVQRLGQPIKKPKKKKSSKPTGHVKAKKHRYQEEVASVSTDSEDFSASSDEGESN